MSYRDFEDLKKIKFRNVSKLDYIANNLDYLYDYVEYLQLNLPGAIFNRHVFKFTRLREEIIFLTVRLSNSSGTGKKSVFRFSVNEKSFWNRFTITNANGEKYNKYDYDPIQIIQYALAKSPSIGSIRLQITDDEKEKFLTYVNSAQENLKQQLLNLNLTNDSIVEILDFTHYSKLTWCYFLNNFITNYPSSSLSIKLGKSNRANVEVGSGLSDYKNSGSEGFYDPSDIDYVNYRKFYDVPYVFEGEDS